jgi:exodeoxyribonuclease III
MSRKKISIATWNVNGIRSAATKGFVNWLHELDADYVCLQEVKAKPEQLEEKLLKPKGYTSFWHSAEKPGYSGVAIYTKHEPLSVKTGLGIPEIDREGRVLLLEYPNFNIISSYFPNSQRDHARLPYKLAFCDRIFKYLEAGRKKGKHTIITGDFNIAHREIDLQNPKSNKKNAGFLPEERAWMDRFIESGYVDTFRVFEKGTGHYTWWSNRPGVRARNIGWRLDYAFMNPEHADRLKAATHLCNVMGSDHCPVVIDLKP